MNEDLRTWFKQKWVRMDTAGKIKGDCGAREEGEGKPKCLPMAKAQAMDKSDRATATRRKRREDPVADREGKGGKPINVRTEAANPAQQAAIAIAMKKAGKKPKNEEVEHLEEKNVPTNPALWSRAKSLARQKFDVYPSAYANGWAAKHYKSKGGGWKSVSEEVDISDDITKKLTKITKQLHKSVSAHGRQRDILMNLIKKDEKDTKETVDEKCWDGYKAVGMKKKNGKKVPNCVPVSEEECPVRRQYKELKKLPIKDLKDRIKRSSRVIDVSGFDKESAISHILRSQHGHKRVNQAFGLDEETKARNATDDEYKKSLKDLMKRPDFINTVRSLKKRDQDGEYDAEQNRKFKNRLSKMKEEAKDEGEYDYEGDMAISQLKSVITNAQKLHDMLEPNTNLPEWVQSKITLAEDYIVTAANYMDGEMNEEANNLKGTPVVSFSDFTDKDDTKNKYGQRVPKKLKKDDPRVKFHKDTMGEAATSDNTGYGKGYHGNVDGGDKQYSSMHTKVKRLVGAAGHLSDIKKPNNMVKHFLDSTHGRHIADQPSDSNITSRFKKFKNTYNPEMNEEAEQMDEISKKTLGSYVKKAAPQLATSLMTAATTKDIANAEFHGKRYAKRNRGIEKAVDKLAKEETQQDPSHYNIVHRDSKRVVGTATTMKRARSARDRHDNKYGSYGHSIVPVFKEEYEQMDEGRMSEIAMDIDDHIKPHIAKYKKIGGAEHLAGKLRQVGEKLAKEHGMPSDWMHKQVSHAAEEHLGDQMNEKYLTPAQRRNRAMSSSGGEFGPKRYGSREDDFGHEAPDRDRVHSEPKDHGLTVHDHEGKEIGTVPKRHFEPMTVAMNIAMKHSRATGQNTEVRRHGKKVESFKGKKVNESKNIIREVIRKAVDKQGTNKANGKTATGSPVPKITINPTALDNLGNKRGIGGT